MPIEVFAFSHKADVVKKSASGGAFSAIVEAFFSIYPTSQAVVYGVTLNENMEAVYQSANTLEQCKKFQGSKYVRSNMRGIAEEITQKLQEGFTVLFSGTPCFVYALKTKLSQWNAPTDKLLCIDLICHGTPEVKYWDAYKKFLEERSNSRLTQYQFRTHLLGKGPYTAIAEFENGRKQIGTLETALFNRLFLRHYTLAEGCFCCRFTNLERQGDLTIGDFWGIEKVMPEFPNGKAVSEILVNTQKGVAVAQWMQNRADWDIQRCMSMDFVRYQNNLQRPAEKPQDYAQFKQEFQNHGFKFVAKKYAGYDFLHRIKEKLCR